MADTNGAGDTFATAYMAALLRGDAEPGSFANWAASRAVMMPQVCVVTGGTPRGWGWASSRAMIMPQVGVKRVSSKG